MQDVIICSTPRTGSTLCGALLVGTGRFAGAMEYFESVLIMPRDILPALGIATVDAVRADVDGYVERIKQEHRGRALCVKVHWRQLQEWTAHGLDLQRHFPGARYIFSTRANVIAQAVSMLRALQTGGWSAQERASGTPTYGFWKLIYEVNGLVSDNAGWEDYFRKHAIEPYRQVYEDLDGDYRSQALKLFDWLGLRLGLLEKRRLKPRLARQRDQLNREWEARFYRDLIHWHAQWEKLPLEDRRRIWGREPG